MTDKYAYAYFDSDGRLKEFIIDPSVRQGNEGFNKIAVYWEHGESFSSIGLSYIETDVVNPSWSEPEVILYNQDSFSIPVIQDYDPRYFQYGKTYQNDANGCVFEFSLPSDILNLHGELALSLYIYDNNDDQIMWMGPITVLLTETGASFQPTITKSQYYFLVDLIETVNNRFNDYVTIATNQTITGPKTFTNVVYLENTLYTYDVLPRSSVTYNLGSDSAYYNIVHTKQLKYGPDTIDIGHIAQTNKSNFFTQGQTFSSSCTFSSGLMTPSILASNVTNFIRTGTTTLNGVNYNLPYTYSQVGNQTYTLATMSDIASAIATVKANTFQVVSELPETGEEGIIYLVPITGSTGYHQYIYESNGWLSIGDTNIDLSDYVPNSRTIAGIDLSSNISSQALTNALVFASDDDIVSIMED